jgi:hypothetical protein
MATTLADWTAALVAGPETTDTEVSSLQAENARKQAIIDEWVGRAFALQESAWKLVAAEHGLSAAHADSDARLALIHELQGTIAALIRERDRAYADSDERLALIHRQQAALADLAEQRTRFAEESNERLALIRRYEAQWLQASAERDRFAAESDERLALIHRQQTRISDIINERDRFMTAYASGRGWIAARPVRANDEAPEDGNCLKGAVTSPVAKRD